MVGKIRTWLLGHCTNVDFVTRQRACLLLLIDLAGFVLSVFVGVFTLVYQDRPITSPQVWTAFLIAAGMAASAVLTLRDKFSIASHTTVLVSFVSIWTLMIDRAGADAHSRSEVVYVIAFLTLPALLLGRKWSLVYGAASVIVAGCASAHLAMAHGFPPADAVGFGVDLVVGSAFVVFVTVLMSRMYEIALERVKSLLALEQEYAAALQRSESQKQQFYRETICSVTNGRLCIYESSEIAAYIDNPDISAEVHDPISLTEARHRVRDFCAANALTGSELDAYIIGVGEATTNAFRHAGGGQVSAGMKDGAIWAAVSDTGAGIESLILPKALLMAGFSTEPSLGLGYTIMLDVSDQVFLSTSEAGTTVVLIKHVTDE